mmetsp:Transcript_134898/g.419168  ORF Transcript_134898/g.419168 Transcript_134898/m.419168 type:complete len:95 (-) Transcript_134898:67-351(-)
MASLKVLLFGPAREAADAGRVEVPLAGLPPARTADEQAPSVADLRKALAEACPALVQLLPLCRFSVEQEMVQDEAATRLSADQEVALIPPISGG